MSGDPPQKRGTNVQSEIHLPTPANERPKQPSCARCWRPVTDGVAGMCRPCFASATRNISPVQRSLLVRAATVDARGVRPSLVLERHELAPARGLVKRDLASTHRTETPSSRFGATGTTRYMKGARRTFRIREAGLAYVERLPRSAPVAVAVPPVDLQEAIGLAHELANLILDGDGDSNRGINRARGVLDRLRGEVGPDGE